MLLLFFFLLLLPSPWMSMAATRCATETVAKAYQRCATLSTQEASVAWTFYPDNATIDVAFTGSFISPSGWVGWGINPTSPRMTGTRALLAFSDPNSGSLAVLPYILDPSVKLQREPLRSKPFDSGDMQLLSSSAILLGGRAATVHQGATVQIFATLRLNPNTTKVHHVWNRGLYVQDYSPAIHPTTIEDLSSVATIDATSGAAAAGRKSAQTMKTMHAALNAVAWGVLLPMGALGARYLRQVQSIGPSWFYAHAATQLAGILIGTVGFAMGIRLGEMSPGVVYGVHRKLGITAFVLGGLQTMALLFRPKATHKFRKYWKSYHHFVGYGCVVVGVVNVFQGFEVMGLGVSYAKLAYCLVLSTWIGVCISLEVNSWVVFCRKAKEEKMRKEGMVVVGGGYEKAGGNH